MRLLIPQEATSSDEEESRVRRWISGLRTVLSSWEFYPILLLASFLRLYRVSTTEFDVDQANVYRMAYDAVHYGLVPATANYSSLGTLNPPGVIYLYLLPAALSADPVWGAVWIGLLSTIGVLITYFFARRYYGRLVGGIAALLFASTSMSVIYGRLIWNQTLLLFFAPLFMALLFRGVIGRKRGWFAPAVALLGLMIQFHNSSGLLIVALLLAVALAPKTIRWPEWLWAGLALLILYAPYLLWEIHTNFADLTIVSNALQKQSIIDNESLIYYQVYLFGHIPAAGSPFHALTRLILLVNWLMTLLVLLGALLVLARLIWPRVGGKQASSHEAEAAASFWRRLLSGWNAFRAAPTRCGLLLLLVWQIFPVAYLAHHAIPIHPSYFLFLMPGPFILIGLLVESVTRWLRDARWLQRLGVGGQVGRYGMVLLVVLLIGVQALAAFASSVDMERGLVSDQFFGLDYKNELNALQHALEEADQAAQARHIKRIYVSMFADHYHMANFSYLSEHNALPTTLFNSACIVLPNPANGPTVLLEGPYEGTAPEVVLAHFAKMTLLDRPFRLGGQPYKLFLVQTTASPVSPEVTYPGHLQYLDARQIIDHNNPLLATRWKILHAEPVQYQTTYSFNFVNLENPTLSANNRLCLMNSLQPGDQIIAHFPLNSKNRAPGQFDLRVRFNTVRVLTWQPDVMKFFGLAFESGALLISGGTLHSSAGSDQVVVPLP